MNKQIQNLIQTEVSRKDFLKTLGFGILSIAGLGTLLKLLSGRSASLPFHSATQGYGSSAYGGTVKKS